MSFLQSWKRILNRRSLKFKLFILLLFISIIPITIVSYSSEYFMFRSSTNYSASISSQFVEFVSSEMSNYLQILDQSFDNLYTNDDFQKYLEIPSHDLAKQSQYMMGFRPIVQNSLQFHPEVLGVLYLDRLGKIYFESYQKQLDPSYSFELDGRYLSVFTVHSPELTASHDLDYILYSKDRVFSYIKPIINIHTGKTQSWFIIEIHEDKLLSMLSGKQSVHEGQLALYDVSNGTTVSKSSISPLTMNDFHINYMETDNQQFLFTSSGIEYEASYAELPGTDWKIVWIAPLSAIKEGVLQTYYLTVFIGAVSLIIALIFAFPAMGQILRPLYKLKQGMQSLGRGHYVPISAVKRNDEIGFLVQSYNQTLIKLQEMEREVYESKIKEKEREVLQLQAQINPHFLFNTLETIESYAVRNHGEAVGDMVQSVARMMRYSIRNDGGWAPVKEEIAYIHNFLTIHYYRNGQEVNAKFEIEPEAQDIPLMKLTIQPFIENAIKYGWSPNMSADDFQLTIQARVQDQFLYISIQDTGLGMSDETLKKLTQFIHDGEATDSFFNKHTGIYNVFRRFVLVYGHVTFFNIESTRGIGTLIEFRIPVMPPANQTNQ